MKKIEVIKKIRYVKKNKIEKKKKMTKNSTIPQIVIFYKLNSHKKIKG